MAKVLQMARTMVGICLLAGALAVVRLAGLERCGLAPSVSAAEAGRGSRLVAAAVVVAPVSLEISGR